MTSAGFLHSDASCAGWIAMTCAGAPEGEISQAVEILRSSGKFKECFFMKRKDKAEVIRSSQLSFLEKAWKRATHGNGRTKKW